MKTTYWLLSLATAVLYIFVFSLALGNSNYMPLDVLWAAVIALVIVSVISAVTLGAIHRKYVGRADQAVVFRNSLIISLRGFLAGGFFIFVFPVFVDNETLGIWRFVAAIIGVLALAAEITVEVLKHQEDETEPTAIPEIFTIAAAFSCITITRPSPEALTMITLLATSMFFYLIAITLRQNEKDVIYTSFMGGVFLGAALGKRLADFGIPNLYGHVSTILGMIFLGVVSILVFHNIFFTAKLDEKSQNVLLYKAFNAFMVVGSIIVVAVLGGVFLLKNAVSLENFLLSLVIYGMIVAAATLYVRGKLFTSH